MTPILNGKGSCRIIFTVLLISVTGCSNPGVENFQPDRYLYNGIQLPEQWPPRYQEPDGPAETQVPYLENKPDFIPVNIGRQLFVDDFLIDETDLNRVHHKPSYHRGNPVLKPEEESDPEKAGDLYAAPFSDGVWYDEREKKFKMWYLAGHSSLITGYAESEDGINWVKPVLDLYGPSSSIVDTFQRDSQTIWLDKLEKDPEKRYKMFQISRNRVQRGWQVLLKYSADGIHWSDGVATSGHLGDRSTAFYNPFRGIWALSLRHYARSPVIHRSRAYLENEDPEVAVSLAHHLLAGNRDRNIVFWFAPSDKEPRHPDFPDITPQIYNFDAIAYESIMLGFYSVWMGPENRVCAELGIQKRNEVLIGYSRDGFHFSRPDYEAFIGVGEEKSSWNWGNVQSVNGVPLIVGDSLYFYVSGRRLNPIMWDSYMSTGLYTLRRDGFVSMHAPSGEGFLKTGKLAFDGKFLFVNADVSKGGLLVEVLDENGIPVRGYSREECIGVHGTNSTRHLITWQGKRDVSSLKGKKIQLRFYLTDGHLYSFWFSPWETGESLGYTAGGGPGLSDDGIDKP
jgi:hypothetical protein